MCYFMGLKIKKILAIPLKIPIWGNGQSYDCRLTKGFILISWKGVLRFVFLSLSNKNLGGCIYN